MAKLAKIFSWQKFPRIQYIVWTTNDDDNITKTKTITLHLMHARGVLASNHESAWLRSSTLIAGCTLASPGQSNLCLQRQA